MSAQNDTATRVFMAARDQGISAVLFRNALGRKLHLNVTDAECLSLLSIRGVSAPTELGRYTGLTTGSTTAMLDRLERAGYIIRKPNPNDRRGVLVEITSKWANTAGPLVADVQHAHRELIARYSTQEQEIIADFLERFTQNVKVQTAAIERCG
jgi:DNA-binding MarR family transcriptional regulator